MSPFRLPLIIIACLTAIALLANPIIVFIAPFEYTGNLNFSYTQGEDTVIRIDFQMDLETRESLTIVETPRPWNLLHTDNSLSLTGGSLSPGESLTIPVSFNKYVSPGERSFTAVATTSGGDSVTSIGVLIVTEMIIVRILSILNQNVIYLITGTTVLLIAEILRMWRKKRSKTSSEQKTVNAETKVPDEAVAVSTIPITQTELHSKLDIGRTKKREKDIGSRTSISRDYGDGADPRDIPPPIIYGEELDVDPKVPPVYVVSDFHVGSNKGVDKRKSNDMDSKTLEIFLKWLDSVDLDAAIFDHYDVVMNGDFIDIWQAKRRKDDTDANRLQDILDSNNSFFSKFAQILRRRYPRCRFYYLLGNHDDALFSSNDGSHYRARNSLKEYLRKDWHSKIVAGEGRIWFSKPNNNPMSFKIDKAYSNSAYRLHIEHGHRFDSFNWKGGKDQAVGRDIAEYINQMQEMDLAFRNGEYTPNQEFVKHLSCLKKNEKTSKKVLDIIDKMESIAMSSSLKNSFWGAVGDGIDYLIRGDRSVLDHKSVDPGKVRKHSRDKGKEIIKKSVKVKIVVLAHTHFRDLSPNSGESNWAYANSGTWLREIQASKDAKKCRLRTKPSPLPYVKISKEKGENKAIVELKFFRGNLRHRMVKVRL